MGHIVFGITLLTYFISLERSCLNEVRQFEMYILNTCMKRIINQGRYGSYEVILKLLMEILHSIYSQFLVIVKLIVTGLKLSNHSIVTLTIL